MITDKKIEKLKGKDKRYTVALGECLYLRVQSSGHKSWVLRYSYCGRVRDLTLGTWPELKVLQAVASYVIMVCVLQDEHGCVILMFLMRSLKIA